jgi:5-methyltetrahydrofolate--homocysteine methyltransferase
VRQQHANKKQTPLWPLAKARANKTPLTGRLHPPVPKFIGRRVFKNFDLAELASIDWGPFFQTWDLAGPTRPSSTTRSWARGAQGVRRRPAHAAEDHRRPLAQRQRRDGPVPGQRVGDDDIEFYTDESRSQVLLTWYGLRQQTEKQAVDGVMRPSRCLADFVAPRTAALPTTPACSPSPPAWASRRRSRVHGRTTTTAAIMLKALADRLAEPLPNACTSACAPTCGATPPTRR